MTVSEYFADNYDEARAKFITAARSMNAVLHSYELPDYRGPKGERLTTDVATIGKSGAENVFLVISGTHGVEGFAGSGCQVGMLQDQIFTGIPENTLIVLVHSLNPYGFAWLRRVNEENVDLNRNFQDFRTELPSAKAYEELHDLLIPLDWEGDARREADFELDKIIENRGLKEIQIAVQRGQYSRPDGLFYGGERASWSNETLRQIIKQHIPVSTKKLVSIDIHTGLGPCGYGELIFAGSSNVDYERCRQWFGESVTNPILGDSVTARVLGTVTEVFAFLPPGIEVGSVALEFGTRPMSEVLQALRADHWLHSRGNGQRSHLYNSIKNQIKRAFYTDARRWKAAVYGKTLTTVLETGRKINVL
jgi:hypothetical protein